MHDDARNDEKMGYEKMARDTLFSGESKNVEYKVTLPDKSEKYMKTIVAFANTQGGKLIVGIDDKTHEIVGVENEILFQVMDGIANFNAAKEYGLLEPKFQEFNNIFRVELFRDSLPMTLENKNIGETSEKHRRNIGEASEKQETVDFNSTQLEILKLLMENNRLSAVKLAEKIGVASRNIENNIKKLKELDILVRHGSPKNGYWEVIDCLEKNDEDTE